jgi:hypothetical protein
MYCMSKPQIQIRFRLEKQSAMHSELLFGGEKEKEKKETTLKGNHIPVTVNFPLESETRISTDWIRYMYYFNCMTTLTNV